jgi:WhiB family redox-sensing transcriptional regulator
MTVASSTVRPGRHAEAFSWQLYAYCRTADPSLFFHPEGERGRARQHRQQKAKEVCAACPVTRQCREHSLIFQESFGTWGGLTEEERSTLQPRAVNLCGRHASV